MIVKTIPIVEIFGPTLAGEGNIAGEFTMFLRTGYCDYRCSWCDSMHAVDPDQVALNATYMPVDQIAPAIVDADSGHTPWVSISGGNPVMHKSLSFVVDDLKSAGYKVNVETQGSMWQDWLTRCDTVTVSPKPPSSGMSHRENPEMLGKILELDQSILKVVAFGSEDLHWASGISSRYPQTPFYVSIGTDPSDTRETLLDRYRAIVEEIQSTPTNPLRRATILPQLHVTLWGHRQGV